jgi:hypothetical protein
MTTRRAGGKESLSTDAYLKLSLQELAERINAHLQRFEADAKINAPRGQRMQTTPYFHAGAGAGASSRRVQLCYVEYQGQTLLTRAQAARYLAWLDAGNVGKHIQVPAGPAARG